MIIIAGHLVVDNVDRDRSVDAHRSLVERARAFHGCVDLAITADSVDARRVNLIEVWESADALDSWRAEADVPEHGILIREAAMQRFDATDGGPLF
jgi:quinol monooxygenase YgiN